jgi:three-Cys-motif partner protein
MATDVEHRFGGPWTDEKLQIVLSYLGFYTKALGNKFPRVVYIDAFAGTGSREFEDESGETQSSDGSALRALDIDPPFGEYIFIEKDPAKAAELERKLATRPERRTRVIVGDANVRLVEFLQSWKSYNSRGVVFLDPFAMSVNWSTLEAIARTNSLDLWFLFPVSSVARNLPLDGNIPKEWLTKLISVFGEDPKPLLYKTTSTPSLFPEEVDEDETFRKSGIKALGAYVVTRMRSIFKGFVSTKALVLKNSNNCPMFMLIYCSANPSERAVKLAKSVVNDILNRHQRGGGDVQGFGD